MSELDPHTRKKPRAQTKRPFGDDEPDAVEVVEQRTADGGLGALLAARFAAATVLHPLLTVAGRRGG